MTTAPLEERSTKGAKPAVSQIIFSHSYIYIAEQIQCGSKRDNDHAIIHEEKILQQMNHYAL